MDNLHEKALSIFTDGSSYSNPRTGGYAARYLYFDEELALQVADYFPLHSYGGATNNEMELLACVEALKAVNSDTLPFTRDQPFDLSKISKISIYSDSQYVVNNVPVAIAFWSKNKWFKKDGNPVSNTELWKELLRQMQKTKMKVEFTWKHGHSKSNPHNVAVDKLAKKSAKLPVGKILSHTKVRRKKTSDSVEVGSIALTGQRSTIRIIDEKYFSVQKLSRYRYEMMSKSSKYYGKVDFVFTTFSLRVGHTYRVKFNKNTKQARIEKVYVDLGAS